MQNRYKTIANYRELRTTSEKQQEAEKVRLSLIEIDYFQFTFIIQLFHTFDLLWHLFFSLFFVV